MSDVEKARALLQAAGLSGVAVGEAETVTISKAELDALRAGAPAAPVVGQPANAAIAPQVQAQAAEIAATVAATGQPPGGELTVDDWEALPEPQRLARMDELDAALARDAGPDPRSNYGHWKAGR